MVIIKIQDNVRANHFIERREHIDIKRKSSSVLE